MNTPVSAVNLVGPLPASPWWALVALSLIVPVGCAGGTNASEGAAGGMSAGDMSASEMGMTETQSPRRETWSDDEGFIAQVAAAEGPEVAEAVRTIRAATADFHDLNAAVAAGYSRDGGSCMDNPPAGGMGFHHANPALMDGTTSIRKPQILTYQRTADGGYELTGVEYVVPKDQWPHDDPPQVMGQELRSSSSLGLWYLHAWVWTPNPDGLFANWNPNVECLP